MAKPRKKTTPRKKARRAKIGTKPKAARTPKAKRRATRARKSPPASRKQRTRKKRTPAARPRAPRARSAARRAPRATATALAIETGLAGNVAATLRGRGHATDGEVVDAIATVCAGYRKGPGSDSPLGIPFNADLEVAREFVDRYLKGTPRAVLDREIHRTTVRSKVDGDLAMFGFADVGETARVTLTSLCLGAWDPGFDEHAKLNGMPSFIVRWYRAGLT